MTISTPRFRLVLLLSLSLNLLLVSALGAIWWDRGHGHGRGFGGVVRMPHMQVLEQVLPDADHAALRAAYQNQRPAIHARFAELRQAKQDVRAALAAVPFDSQALDRALATMRTREQAVAEAAHVLLIEVAAGVSDDGRAALAKIVTSRRMWRGERPARRERSEATAQAGDSELY